MTDKKYPIGGYAPGDYLRSCTTCEKQFHGNKEAFQCESCAIKDKEFYDALTPEQRDRFDKRFANIVKLFFEGRDKDEEIARLRYVLEWYADPGNYLDENSDLATAWKMDENIANKAKEAIKKQAHE